MENEKLEQHKTRLLEEKANLEKELSTVGRINPDNPADWEPTPADTDRDTDPNDKADNMEEFENNTAILKQLETQLLGVNEALKRVEDGTYGICDDCGKVISDERLNANTSATTCVEHMS